MGCVPRARHAEGQWERHLTQDVAGPLHGLVGDSANVDLSHRADEIANDVLPALWAHRIRHVVPVGADRRHDLALRSRADGLARHDLELAHVVREPVQLV